ncbi:hypothetical protein TRVA0_002S05468 [Trichomonascus vanleenenianus]|uniref:ferric reductase family protein n=1 Tax=Trichomonascus vanleenenianus TaxID=2268995 RepID=UPI003ECA6E95
MFAAEEELDSPYYRENPFEGPAGEELIERVLDGRVLCQHYLGLLLAALAIVVISHWVTKLYISSRRIRLHSSSSRPHLDVELQQEPEKSAQSLWRRARLKVDAFLMSQPDGEDTESWGMIFFLAIYLALTLFYSFYDTSYHPLVLGFRLGMLTCMNLAFLYILGAKHTPLSWLTGWSYEQVNVLHRWNGAYCVFAIIIHTAVFLYYFKLSYCMTNLWTIMGMIAGLSFFIIGATSIKTVRIKIYELFYACHFFLSVISMPAIFFHYPTSRPYVVVCAISFAYDKLFRVLFDYRFVRCDMSVAPGDTVIVKIHQNPEDGLFFRRPYSYKKGQHIFLTVVGCGILQSHPFTIASHPACSETLDVIIRARQGFSRRLLDQLLANGSQKVTRWAIMHGPYGVEPLGMPDAYIHADQEKTPRAQCPSFVPEWTDRFNSSSRFAPNEEPGSTAGSPLLVENENRRQRQKIILVSGGAGVAFTYPMYLEYQLANESQPDGAPLFDVEFLWVVPRREFSEWVDLVDPGKMRLWVTREQGRPDLNELIRDMVGDSSRVWLGCCGPENLLRACRNTIADLRAEGNSEMHYYAERFGW